jgi:carbon-monoxide dehydrogenase medium subunit
MWKNTISPVRIDEALEILAERGSKARIVAGATDLILEIGREQRKGIDTLIDITRISGLDQILRDEEGIVHLGPLVTHNQCVASKIITESAFLLARACWEVGSPQIRNRGTIAGNLITASPANDTITPLFALDAWVTLKSIQNGEIFERQVPLKDFYTGVRRTVMKPEEMLVDLSFRPLQKNQKSAYMKFALRRAQAISLVNAAVILTVEKDGILDARITLGAVAPTIIHAEGAETYLIGKKLTDETIASAADLAVQSARPIDDVRGSAIFRQKMVKTCVSRSLKMIRDGKERGDFPDQPVLLWGNDPQPSRFPEITRHDETTPIVTNINGKEYVLPGGQNKTLLHLLREDAGLIGSKEGCSEGECGACTVFLDGMAVMSCLVPAARAHGAKIITVEGLAEGDHLHPVQEAFIEEGAVQCGYCTPGFLMSAAKLLEERPHPDQKAIQQAITGNLCRCTGYYKIVKAIERAAEKETV